MIEITTSIALLMSSLYGASTTPAVANVEVIKLNTASSTDGTTIATVTTDRKTLEKYLRENYADTPILVDIARCESTFTHYDKKGEIIRGKANNADVGVMQINEKYHLENAKKLGIDIHTVDGNIAYAKYLYEKFGSEPWSASSPCWGKSITSNTSQNQLVKNN